MSLKDSIARQEALLRGEILKQPTLAEFMRAGGTIETDEFGRVLAINQPRATNLRTITTGPR